MCPQCKLIDDEAVQIISGAGSSNEPSAGMFVLPRQVAAKHGIAWPLAEAKH